MTAQKALFPIFVHGFITTQMETAVMSVILSHADWCTGLKSLKRFKHCSAFFVYSRYALKI